MARKILNKEEKEAELKKYRDLFLATIDYYIDNDIMKIKTASFDSVEHYKSLKIQAKDHYKKGRLSRLKQWFRHVTEMQVEAKDFKFNTYLQDKTKYDIDIFKSYFLRIDKIIEKGSITTDSQFYDISSMVDQLCQTLPADESRIKILNKLISGYEQKKTGRQKKGHLTVKSSF